MKAKQTELDQRIGRMAALEDLIEQCECDIGDFRRSDLNKAQVKAMWAELRRLHKSLNNSWWAEKRKLTRAQWRDYRKGKA